MEFHNEPESAGPPALRILIVKHDKAIKCKILTRDWCGVRTHWWGGHTIACCGTENCRACETQNWVKKYYLVAEGFNTQTQAIIMLTPLAAGQIKRHRSRATGFLGCELLLTRAAARDTAPMQAMITGYHPDTTDFGSERLNRIITRIFRENAHGVG